MRRFRRHLAKKKQKKEEAARAAAAEAARGEAERERAKQQIRANRRAVWSLDDFDYLNLEGLEEQLKQMRVREILAKESQMLGTPSKLTEHGDQAGRDNQDKDAMPGIERYLEDLADKPMSEFRDYENMTPEEIRAVADAAHAARKDQGVVAEEPDNNHEVEQEQAELDEAPEPMPSSVYKNMYKYLLGNASDRERTEDKQPKSDDTQEAQPSRYYKSMYKDLLLEISDGEDTVHEDPVVDEPPKLKSSRSYINMYNDVIAETKTHDSQDNIKDDEYRQEYEYENEGGEHPKLPPTRPFVLEHIPRFNKYSGTYGRGNEEGSTSKVDLKRDHDKLDDSASLNSEGQKQDDEDNDLYEGWWPVEETTSAHNQGVCKHKDNPLHSNLCNEPSTRPQEKEDNKNYHGPSFTLCSSRSYESSRDQHDSKHNQSASFEHNDETLVNNHQPYVADGDEDELEELLGPLKSTPTQPPRLLHTINNAPLFKVLEEHENFVRKRHAEWEAIPPDFDIEPGPKEKRNLYRQAIEAEKDVLNMATPDHLAEVKEVEDAAKEMKTFVDKWKNTPVEKLMDEISKAQKKMKKKGSKKHVEEEEVGATVGLSREDEEAMAERKELRKKGVFPYNTWLWKELSSSSDDASGDKVGTGDANQEKRNKNKMLQEELESLAEGPQGSDAGDALAALQGFKMKVDSEDEDDEPIIHSLVSDDEAAMADPPRRTKEDKAREKPLPRLHPLYRKEKKLVDYMVTAIKPVQLELMENNQFFAVPDEVRAEKTELYKQKSRAKMAIKAQKDQVKHNRAAKKQRRFEARRETRSAFAHRLVASNEWDILEVSLTGYSDAIADAGNIWDFAVGERKKSILTLPLAPELARSPEWTFPVWTEEMAQIEYDSVPDRYEAVTQAIKDSDWTDKFVKGSKLDQKLMQQTVMPLWNAMTLDERAMVIGGKAVDPEVLYVKEDKALKPTADPVSCSPPPIADPFSVDGKAIRPDSFGSNTTSRTPARSSPSTEQESFDIRETGIRPDSFGSIPTSSKSVTSSSSAEKASSIAKDASDSSAIVGRPTGARPESFRSNATRSSPSTEKASFSAADPNGSPAMATTATAPKGSFASNVTFSSSIKRSLREESVELDSLVGALELLDMSLQPQTGHLSFDSVTDSFGSDTPKVAEREPVVNYFDAKVDRQTGGVGEITTQPTPMSGKSFDSAAGSSLSGQQGGRIKSLSLSMTSSEAVAAEAEAKRKTEEDELYFKLLQKEAVIRHYLPERTFSYNNAAWKTRVPVIDPENKAEVNPAVFPAIIEEVSEDESEDDGTSDSSDCILPWERMEMSIPGRNNRINAMPNGEFDWLRIADEYRLGINNRQRPTKPQRARNFDLVRAQQPDPMIYMPKDGLRFEERGYFSDILPKPLVFPEVTENMKNKADEVWVKYCMDQRIGLHPDDQGPDPNKLVSDRRASVTPSIKKEPRIAAQGCPPPTELIERYDSQAAVVMAMYQALYDEYRAENTEPVGIRFESGVYLEEEVRLERQYRRELQMYVDQMGSDDARVEFFKEVADCLAESACVADDMFGPLRRPVKLSKEFKPSNGLMKTRGDLKPKAEATGFDIKPSTSSSTEYVSIFRQGLAILSPPIPTEASGVDDGASYMNEIAKSLSGRSARYNPFDETFEKRPTTVALEVPSASPRAPCVVSKEPSVSSATSSVRFNKKLQASKAAVLQKIKDPNAAAAAAAAPATPSRTPASLNSPEQSGDQEPERSPHTAAPDEEARSGSDGSDSRPSSLIVATKAQGLVEWLDINKPDVEVRRLLTEEEREYITGALNTPSVKATENEAMAFFANLSERAMESRLAQLEQKAQCSNYRKAFVADYEKEADSRFSVGASLASSKAGEGRDESEFGDHSGEDTEITPAQAVQLIAWMMDVRPECNAEYILGQRFILYANRYQGPELGLLDDDHALPMFERYALAEEARRLAENTPDEEVNEEDGAWSEQNRGTASHRSGYQTSVLDKFLGNARESNTVSHYLKPSQVRIWLDYLIRIERGFREVQVPTEMQAYVLLPDDVPPRRFTFTKEDLERYQKMLMQQLMAHHKRKRAYEEGRIAYAYDVGTDPAVRIERLPPNQKQAELAAVNQKEEIGPTDGSTKLHNSPRPLQSPKISSVNRWDDLSSEASGSGKVRLKKKFHIRKKLPKTFAPLSEVDSADAGHINLHRTAHEGAEHQAHGDEECFSSPTMSASPGGFALGLSLLRHNEEENESPSPSPAGRPRDNFSANPPAVDFLRRVKIGEELLDLHQALKITTDNESAVDASSPAPSFENKERHRRPSLVTRFSEKLKATDKFPSRKSVERKLSGSHQPSPLADSINVNHTSDGVYNVHMSSSMRSSPKLKDGGGDEKDNQRHHPSSFASVFGNKKTSFIQRSRPTSTSSWATLESDGSGSALRSKEQVYPHDAYVPPAEETEDASWELQGELKQEEVTENPKMTQKITRLLAAIDLKVAEAHAKAVEKATRRAEKRARSGSVHPDWDLALLKQAINALDPKKKFKPMLINMMETEHLNADEIELLLDMIDERDEALKHLKAEEEKEVDQDYHIQEHQEVMQLLAEQCEFEGALARVEAWRDAHKEYNDPDFPCRERAADRAAKKAAKEDAETLAKFTRLTSQRLEGLQVKETSPVDPILKDEVALLIAQNSTGPVRAETRAGASRALKRRKVKEQELGAKKGRPQAGVFSNAEKPVIHKRSEGRSGDNTSRPRPSPLDNEKATIRETINHEASEVEQPLAETETPVPHEKKKSSLQSLGARLGLKSKGVESRASLSPTPSFQDTFGDAPIESSLRTKSFGVRLGFKPKDSGSRAPSPTPSNHSAPRPFSRMPSRKLKKSGLQSGDTGPSTPAGSPFSPTPPTELSGSAQQSASLGQRVSSFFKPKKGEDQLKPGEGASPARSNMKKNKKSKE